MHKLVTNDNAFIDARLNYETNSKCLVKINVTPSYHRTHNKYITVTGNVLSVSHELNIFVPCVFDSKHHACGNKL